MRKKILVLITIIFSTTTLLGQDKDIIIEPKLNLGSLAAGIFNPALELGFGEKSAVEFSYVGAYAKFNFLGSGEPFMLCMVMAEYRHYWLNNLHKGFFTGAHVGGNMFKTNKVILPAIGYEGKIRSYDWGMGTMIGATVGYKFVFKRNFALELSLSGGWHFAWHEPHYQINDNTYEILDLNRSAEWLPYKAGIYFSYRF